MKCPICKRKLIIIGKCGYCKNKECGVERCQIRNKQVVTMVSQSYKAKGVHKMAEKEEMYHNFVYYIIRPFGTTIIIFMTFWLYLPLFYLSTLSWKKGAKIYLKFIKEQVFEDNN